MRFTCPGLFVTGTGTGVGKTVVAAHLLRHALAAGRRVCYQKLVSTGDDADCADLLFCRRVAGYQPAPELLALAAPCVLKRAASPHLAAEMEGRVIDPATLIRAFRGLTRSHELVIVEGAGGPLVPLCRDLLAADLVARLGIPALLVAPSGLGAINHSLLCIEALRARDISILGMVFVDGNATEDEVIARDNMRTIAAFGRIEVFGRLPRRAPPDSEAAVAAFTATMRGLLTALTTEKKDVPASSALT